MNEGDIQFWALIVGIGGLIVTIIVTWWQLRQNVQLQRVQLFHNMFNELRSLHLKVIELIAEIKNKESGKEKDREGERKAIVAEYLNYLEHLALLINTKHINEYLAKKAFRKIVVEDAPENFKDEIDKKIYIEYFKLLTKWKAPRKRCWWKPKLLFCWGGRERETHK